MAKKRSASTTTSGLGCIAEPLRALAIPIADLASDPANARRHPERNLAAVEASLRAYGQRKPLVVRKAGMIVEAGNGTLEAAKRLGWTHVAAVIVDDDAVTATGFAIADNRTAELAEWDEDALAASLESLRLEDVDLGDLGWTDGEFDRLMTGIDAGPEGGAEDAGPSEPPAVAKSQAGEIYALGPHRLLCGDSTDAEQVARLMGGEKAALFATDPPYCVDYTGSSRPGHGKDWSGVYNEVEIKDAEGFFRAFVRVGLGVCEDNAALYCWHAHARAALIERVWSELGVLYHQQIVWVKPCIVPTFSVWAWKHEPCLMGWRRGNKPDHDGDNTDASSTVWAEDWDGKAHQAKLGHPTSKPTRLFERPILKHTKPGALVYEPFCGSGSQLIAAAKTGRRCYAVELSPVFCDVIRKRWGDYARSAGIDPGPDAL